MASIEIIFGSYTFPFVTSVIPGSDLSTEMIVGASKKQYRKNTLQINGYVLNYSKSALASAQKDLANSVSAIGTALLQYPGTDSYQARVTNISWEEWNGNPIIRYTITLETSEDNPFSRNVNIDGHALVPIPKVSDQYQAHNIDETISLTHQKKITLEGKFEGTVIEIDAYEQNLRSWIIAAATVNLTIPAGVFVCKVSGFEVGTPDVTSTGIIKTYSVNFETYPNYTLEDFHSGDNGLTIIGISIDVTSSYKHSITRDNSGNITAESINVSGKKYFTTFLACNDFKTTIDQKVVAGITLSSLTGNTLLLKDVGWSEPKRDGHFSTGERRYSLSFNLSFDLDTSSSQVNPGTVFGIVFTDLNSLSYSASIDGTGIITTRSKSGSGKVAPANLPSFRPGISISEDSYLYYITSLNFGAKDKAGLTQVSVSGQTLDSTQAALELMPYIFNGFHLDHLTNKNKSVSYQWDDCVDAYIAVSISRSVSGYRWDNDGDIELLIRTINRVAFEFFITSVSVSERELANHDGVDRYRFSISISGTEYLKKPGECKIKNDIEEQMVRTIEDATVKFALIPIPGAGIVYKKIAMNPALETITITRTARTIGIYRTMAIPADPATSLGAESYKIKRTTTESGLKKAVSVKYQLYTITNIF